MRVTEDLDDKWIALSGKYENRVEFAAHAKQDQLSHVLFGLWSGNMLNFDDMKASIKPTRLMDEVLLRESRRFMSAYAELRKTLKEEEIQLDGQDQSTSV